MIRVVTHLKPVQESEHAFYEKMDRIFLQSSNKDITRRESSTIQNTFFMYLKWNQEAFKKLIRI